ncbi:MAG: thiosulfate oxidation carrier protein SoxY [Burkholderiales bacterium]|nr:thiosulfate oxidation carrier protein SoxY [Burkholderiales bacterium]
MKRRSLLKAGAILLGTANIRHVHAQNFLPPQDLKPFIEALTRGAPVRAGRVTMEMPAIAENGNSIPFLLRVASPMTPADHVKSVHIFAPRNPRPQVAAFQFGPHAPRAEVATRVRLAGSQKVLAIAAMSDGSFWSGELNIVVTAAACLDEALG